MSKFGDNTCNKGAWDYSLVYSDIYENLLHLQRYVSSKFTFFLSLFAFCNKTCCPRNLAPCGVRKNLPNRLTF